MIELIIMNKSHVILAVLGIAICGYVGYTLHLQNKANNINLEDHSLTLEFTKAGMVAPALKFEQPASIHIITDEKNTLIDVQVIPISDKK